MGRQRRKFSSALKARVAIEAIKGHRSVSELAGEHQVHPSQITQWKKQLLDSAEQLFSDRRVTEKKDQEELLAKLYQQIGQMKVELDWLQKKLWSN
jgi:putative transposase